MKPRLSFDQSAWHTKNIVISLHCRLAPSLALRDSSMTVTSFVLFQIFSFNLVSRSKSFITFLRDTCACLSNFPLMTHDMWPLCETHAVHSSDDDDVRSSMFEPIEDDPQLDPPIPFELGTMAFAGTCCTYITCCSSSNRDTRTSVICRFPSRYAPDRQRP